MFIGCRTAWTATNAGEWTFKSTYNFQQSFFLDTWIFNWSFSLDAEMNVEQGTGSNYMVRCLYWFQLHMMAQLLYVMSELAEEGKSRQQSDWSQESNCDSTLNSRLISLTPFSQLPPSARLNIVDHLYSSNIFNRKHWNNCMPICSVRDLCNSSSASVNRSKKKSVWLFRERKCN